MDSFKGLTKRAWKAFKSAWIINIILVFTVGVLVNGYTMSTNAKEFIKVTSNDNIIVVEADPDATKEVVETLRNKVVGSSNASTIDEFLRGMNISPDSFIPNTAGTRYTKGVISVFVNDISSSGNLVFGILSAVNTLVFQNKIASSITIFVGALIMALGVIFIKNIVYVGQCRYFMEHRIYKNTHPDRLVHIYRFGKTFNVAKVMFIRSVFQSLWDFTIIGGFIKHYEYSMIPYILAENPDIKWKDAFALSRVLTLDHKRKMFAMDLAYGLGYLISSFSYDFISTFFIDPFRACFYAEIYADLRKTAIEGEFFKTEYLIDRQLDYDVMRDATYPEQLYPYKPLEKRQWLKIDYARDYSISTFILFFFSFSFVGWVWEVFYTLVTEGILANRGTMFGPWLPIYGFGGLAIMICLKPLRKRPFLLFMGAFVLCGALEYFAAWMLETLFHSKWWDYTGFYLNLHGRICLEGLLVFGLAGVAFTYIFSPMLDNLYKKLKPSSRKALCIILPILFAIDLCYSAFNPNKGAGVTTGSDETTISVEAESSVD